MTTARNGRRSSTGGGSSHRSFSQDEVDTWSAENENNTTIPGGTEATASRHARSGMVAVRVSERFHSRGSRRGEGNAAPASSRADVASLTALGATESCVLTSRHGDDAGRNGDDAANRVRSFSSSSNDTRHIGADDARRLEEGNASIQSETEEAHKTSLADANKHGGRLHSHRNRDVGVLGALRTVLFGARDPESDLSIEMLEELHMVTGFTYKELRITRSHFLGLVKDASFITREEFLEISSVANNPLKERLLVCFGFDSMDNLKFKEFVEILSIFNNPSAQRDQKLRMAFTLVDIDGDGQVSKNDLVRYLDLITAAPEGVKLDLNAVAARIIEEGVSTPGAKSLSLADFIKIMGAADFADKLTIPL